MLAFKSASASLCGTHITSCYGHHHRHILKRRLARFLSDLAFVDRQLGSALEPWPMNKPGVAPVLRQQPDALLCGSCATVYDIARQEHVLRSTA